jgi:hypothetical protein
MVKKHFAPTGLINGLGHFFLPRCRPYGTLLMLGIKTADSFQLKIKNPHSSAASASSACHFNWFYLSAFFA